MPPRGGNLYTVVFIESVNKFQLMPPRGGNLGSKVGVCARRSFNSCPREGAIVEALAVRLKLIVSTHAPARGQSQNPLKKMHLRKVSTHAPARGQSLKARICRFALRCFNSCPREGAISVAYFVVSFLGLFQLMPPRGGNLDEMFSSMETIIVSTHAPARVSMLHDHGYYQAD